MVSLETCYLNFCNHLEILEEYCKSLEIKKNAISEFLDKKNYISDDFEKYILKSQKISTSPIEYNALVISIFGSFELFISKILKEYSTILCKNTSRYEDLPEKLKNKHQKQLGEFLTNSNRYKYLELDSLKVITNFNNAIVEAPIKLSENIDLLIINGQGGNLKSSQLFSLFNELGIENFEWKATDNYELKEYWKELYERKKQEKKIFEILDTLVDIRNSIAHSWIEENRISYKEIREKYLYFMKCLSKAIFEILVDELILYTWSTWSKKILFTFEAINVYDNHILCINNKEVLFEVGDYFIIKNSEGKTFPLSIKSIEINSKKVSKVEEKNVKIGIELEKIPNKRIKESYIFSYLPKNSINL